MDIKTSDIHIIKPFLEKLYIPAANSHKGDNGRVLIIGGSSLFHSASLWAAEIASHFVDMVHYSSTIENNKVFHELKSVFRNGIIVEHKDIPHYIEEDDAILIGPGMIRAEMKREELREKSFEEILKIEDEGIFTRELAHYLFQHFPDKKFVIDAGALQMMDVNWLKKFQTKPIITPHQHEFERLFSKHISNLSLDQKKEIVKEYAKEYHCVILLKAVVDIISDGDEVVTIEGGNPGLTKGGSGDILAGLTVSLFSKNEALTAAIVASVCEKQAAEELGKRVGYWYNMADLIGKIPEHFKRLTSI